MAGEKHDIDLHEMLEWFRSLRKGTADKPGPREWLVDLDDDDIEVMVAVVGAYRSARTVGRFGKWLLMSMLAVFLSAVAFGEGISKMVGWWKGAGH